MLFSMPRIIKHSYNFFSSCMYPETQNLNFQFLFPQPQTLHRKTCGYGNKSTSQNKASVHRLLYITSPKQTAYLQTQLHPMLIVMFRTARSLQSDPPSTRTTGSAWATNILACKHSKLIIKQFIRSLPSPHSRPLNIQMSDIRVHQTYIHTSDHMKLKGWTNTAN